MNYRELEFMDQAICNDDFTEQPEAVQKAICGRCPVRLRCALFGLGDGAVAGGEHLRQGPSIVYGGLNLAELAELAEQLEQPAEGVAS